MLYGVSSAATCFLSLWALPGHRCSAHFLDERICALRSDYNPDEEEQDDGPVVAQFRARYATVFSEMIKYLSICVTERGYVGLVSADC